MVGKTISKYYYDKLDVEHDDIPYLTLEMTDGTKFRIVATYGSYTGNSMDEYPRIIYFERIK